LVGQDNPNSWGDQNDPFREEFYLVPHDEVLRERAEQVRQDNRDALRHFVEVAIWEALDNPELLRVLLSLLWHWEAIDPKWAAEASFMTISDLHDLAESPALMIFSCLDCGTEIVVRSRRQLIRTQRALDEYCKDETGNGVPNTLFCQACREQRKGHVEQQSRLDRARQEALLKEYRKRPYAERRMTQEWAILKKQVHRRDEYRCRLCGRDDVELHVHHRTYKTYAEERLEDLITLCRSCHEHFHFLSEAS
jgi:5-methylcytosine-specific restriction endonuclease McrA